MNEQTAKELTDSIVARCQQIARIQQTLGDEDLLTIMLRYPETLPPLAKGEK
jgi:hypothetical protein